MCHVYTANSWHVICVQSSWKRSFLLRLIIHGKRPYRERDEYKIYERWVCRHLFHLWFLLWKCMGRGWKKKEEFLFQTTPPKWCGIQHRTSTAKRRRNTRQKYKRARSVAMQLRMIRGKKREATRFADNFNWISLWIEQTWKIGLAKFTSKRIVHIRLSNKIHSVREYFSMLASEKKNVYVYIYLFSLDAIGPPVGPGLLIHEVF